MFGAWVQRNAREIFLFALGAGGFVHELLAVSTERPFLIAASLALMGLPFFLASDKLVSRKAREQRTGFTSSGVSSGSLDAGIAREKEIRELRRQLKELEESE